MNQLGKNFVLCVLAVLGFLVKGASQDGNPLQFLDRVGQSVQYNPAYQNHSEKLVVGLPLVSGISFDYKSNFSMDYMFYRNFNYSFNRFYNELGEPGDAEASISFPFLFLSLKKDQHNFSFSIRERIRAETRFDHELLQFIDKGLSHYYENDKTFGPIHFKNFYYREVALAYSNKIWDGLTIGVRPKLWFAHFYYNIVDLNYTVETNTLAEQLMLSPVGSYQISAPVKVTYIEELTYTEIRPNPQPTDYFFGFKNLSPAIDFGVNYTSDTGWEIAASVLDIGFLRFKHDNYNIEFTEAINYNKENLYQSNNPDAPNYTEPKIALQQITDSIPFIITATPISESIRQNIPLRFNLSLKKALTKQSEAGIAGELKILDGDSEQVITGFVHTQFNPKFELAGTISLLNFNKILPGVGVSYTGRWLQYYLSANNITALAKPSSAKYLNLCFGVNFLFSTVEK